MAQYKVNSESLSGTAGQISQARERIMDEIKTVIRQVEATKDFWEGSAQGTYNELMARWGKAADGVQDALNQTVVALQRAAEDYNTTEQNQVNRFNV
ncbi:MAG: WXG100 family type VII secretion target [Ilumatobacteraceae bacterium]|jgi:WXG100 family type VII secretion target